MWTLSWRCFKTTMIESSLSIVSIKISICPLRNLRTILRIMLGLTPGTSRCTSRNVRTTTIETSATTSGTSKCASRSVKTATTKTLTTIVTPTTALTATTTTTTIRIAIVTLKRIPLLVSPTAVVLTTKITTSPTRLNRRLHDYKLDTQLMKGFVLSKKDGALKIMKSIKLLLLGQAKKS